MNVLQKYNEELEKIILVNSYKKKILEELSKVDVNDNKSIDEFSFKIQGLVTQIKIEYKEEYNKRYNSLNFHLKSFDNDLCLDWNSGINRIITPTARPFRRIEIDENSNIVPTFL